MTQLISLDIYQTLCIGAIALAIGLFLVSRSKNLRRFCIPAAVVGGLVVTLIVTLVHTGGIAEITFDSTLKDVFMMAFFCSVGFTASFRTLKMSGKLIFILTGLVAVLIAIQDVIGPAMCAYFGMDPKLGLALGSISLVGGHGTSASFGSQLVSEFGVANADTVALAAATAGMAFSGFIGGPLARRRVEKRSLHPDEQDSRIETEGKVERTIDNNRFLHALMMIAICMGAGTIIIEASKSAGIILPTYFGAMIVAVVIRNVCDLRKFELPLEEINTLGWISLSMFLAIALMSIRLWEVVDLAGMMALILIVQFIVVALFAYFIVFRVTGKNYDSAALVAAVCGFGLGATPNAMANMEALFKEYGTSTAAYLAVPVVGGVLLDIVNTTMLTLFMNIL